MDPREIAALDDDAFRRLILRHVHYTVGDPAVWEALLSPDLASRTRDALRGIVQGLSSRMTRMRQDRDAFQNECFARGEAGKREWFATRADYEKERGRLASLHRALQNRLTEAGKVQRDTNRQNSVDFGQHAREALRKLSLAVHRHQAAHARSGTIAEQCDYELWRLLDTLTVPVGPDNEQVKLRTMLDIYWTDVEPVAAAQDAVEDLEPVVRSAPVGGADAFNGASRARRIGSDHRLT